MNYEQELEKYILAMKPGVVYEMQVPLGNLAPDETVIEIDEDGNLEDGNLVASQQNLPVRDPHGVY